MPLCLGAQGATSPASAAPPPARLQAPAAAFARRDWPAALAAYEALAKEYPSDALSRFRVGIALLELNRLSEAEASLREGEKLGIPAPQAAYRLAQLFAEMKRPDAAIAELERARAAQLFLAPSALAADRHLASLKSHSKWSAVLTSFDALVRPCMHDARYREFDFWVGDWDVRPTGQPAVGQASRNTITLEDNGCVVTEHWVAPNGSEGQSFNIFDQSYGVWRQTWVDNVGGQHDYRGKLEKGNMVYYGDLPGSAPGQPRQHTRLTFFNISKDSVRQFSEVSNDSGKTWSVGYDLMYVRRPPRLSETTSFGGPLTPSDQAALRALDSVFVSGWLGDDTTQVLSVFAPDAVLMPPGAAAVTGLSAIRGYWWPKDGSTTRIRSFQHTITEMGGTRTLAFVRGTGTMTWDYTKAGKTTTQTTRSADMRLLMLDANGRWQVVRHIWNALP